MLAEFDRLDMKMGESWRETGAVDKDSSGRSSGSGVDEHREHKH